MTEANKNLVRRYYEEVLNQRHIECLDELAAANFASYLSNGASIDLSIYRQAVMGSLAAMPDLHVVIDDQIAEGDKVVTRWTATGTPQVPFAGIQPGGKPIRITAIHIHRVEDGRLVEHWEAINLHAAQ
jgi:predicted ester cyclase